MNVIFLHIEAVLAALPDTSEAERELTALSASVSRPTSDDVRKWREINKRYRLTLIDAKDLMRAERKNERDKQRDALIERIGHVTIATERASYKVLALRSSLIEFSERIAATLKPQRRKKISSDTRNYPKFVPTMTTADYVRRYIALNVNLNLSRPEHSCANYTDCAPMLDPSVPEVLHEII